MTRCCRRPTSTSMAQGLYGPAEIVGYEWRVLQPNGSLSTFWPSAEGAHVSFETNIVGPYVFSLTVTDARGERSCVAAEYTVVVTSDEAIHVAVSWQVPGDPDASDEAEPGKPDVDLHFLHPLAEGRFYGEHDCYFANPNPEWGIFSPSDNPYLHVSDDGPESLRRARTRCALPRERALPRCRRARRSVGDRSHLHLRRASRPMDALPRGARHVDEPHDRVAERRGHAHR